MRKENAWLIALTLLLASCVTVPIGQLPPDPQACLATLPELDPKLEDAQGLLSIETMQNFLRGSLPLRLEFELSATPATSSTTGRKPR